MMEEIYGLPSSNSEGYPACYTHHEAPFLPPTDGEEYEAFVRAPWLSTSSVVSLSAHSAAASDDDRLNTCNSTHKSGSSSLQEETFIAIRATISSHPLYPKLLEAYIDCQKVGAPPEMANLLDEILQENDVSRNTTVSYCFGEDPELDEFMETYCGVLAKCKLDLARPYDEATTFLSNIASQLSNLCNNTASVLGFCLVSHSLFEAFSCIFYLVHWVLCLRIFSDYFAQVAYISHDRWSVETAHIGIRTGAV